MVASGRASDGGINKRAVKNLTALLLVILYTIYKKTWKILATFKLKKI